MREINVDDQSIINDAIPYGNVKLKGHFLVNSSYPINLHDIDGGSLSADGFGTTISNPSTDTSLSKATIILDNCSNFNIHDFAMIGYWGNIPNGYSSSGNIALLNDSDNISISNMKITGGFDGVSVGIPDGVGETRIASHGVEISNVMIEGTEHRLRSCGGYDININNVDIENVQRGIFLQGSHNINNIRGYTASASMFLISGQSIALSGAPDADTLASTSAT